MNHTVHSPKEKSKPLIALDFDDTYTLNPEFWNRFIDDAQASGFDVAIVTFRMSEHTHPSLDWLKGKVSAGVWFTNHTAKKNFMLRRGLEVAIWIDDAPDLILHGI